MSKLFKTITAVFAICVLFSCSDDEGVRDLARFGFNYNSNFYVLNTASYVDENVADDTTPSRLSITLSNVDLYNSDATSGVNSLYFDFDGIALAEGEIAQINDYYIEIGGSFVANTDPEVEGVTYTYVNGTLLLDAQQSGLIATEKSVVINSIDDNTIDLTYSFTRADGQVFSGNYIGTFTDNSPIPEE